MAKRTSKEPEPKVTDGPEPDTNPVGQTPPEPPTPPAGVATDGAQPREHVEARAVSPGDTTKFEADVDAAFSGRQNGTALALAVKNAGAALQAEQAASGFSDVQAIRIYDDLVELSRTLGAGTPWA